MKMANLGKILTLLFIFIFLSASISFAKQLNIIEKFLYREVYVIQPDGQETAALVNKVTDVVDYVWAVNQWIEAPDHIKWCYKNRRSIRSWSSGLKRRTPGRR